MTIEEPSRLAYGKRISSKLRTTKQWGVVKRETVHVNGEEREQHEAEGFACKLQTVRSFDQAVLMAEDVRRPHTPPTNEHSQLWSVGLRSVSSSMQSDTADLTGAMPASSIVGLVDMAITLRSRCLGTLLLGIATSEPKLRPCAWKPKKIDAVRVQRQHIKLSPQRQYSW